MSSVITSNEILHTAEWIVAKLEGDNGAGGLFDPALPVNQRLTGAFYDLIPPEKGLPAVRFHVQNTHDTRQAMGSPHRIMVRLDWLVCVVHEGLGLTKLVTLADRLDNLLHESNGETSTVRVMQCIRLQPYSETEPEDSGVTYRHIGGLYRTIVQSK